jgi:hypothetical protein
LCTKKPNPQRSHSIAITVRTSRSDVRRQADQPIAKITNVIGVK